MQQRVIYVFTGLGLAYLGILATVIAFNWYYEGIQEIGAAKAAIFINLVPMFAIIFGTIFLQESLSAIAVLMRVPLRLTANGALRQRREATLLLKEAVGRIAFSVEV